MSIFYWPDRLVMTCRRLNLSRNNCLLFGLLPSDAFMLRQRPHTSICRQKKTPIEGGGSRIRRGRQSRGLLSRAQPEPSQLRRNCCPLQNPSHRQTTAASNPQQMTWLHLLLRSSRLIQAIPLIRTKILRSLPRRRRVAMISSYLRRI